MSSLVLHPPRPAAHGWDALPAEPRLVAAVDGPFFIRVAAPLHPASLTAGCLLLLPGVGIA